MQIIKRFSLVPLLLLGLMQTAAAIEQVAPYTTSVSPSGREFARIVPITEIISSAVTFESADNLGTTDIATAVSTGSIIFEVCPDSDSACVTTQDTASSPIPIPEGTINLENGNVVFRPTDPTSTASVSFVYGVFVPESVSNTPSGQASLTINIQTASVSRSNMIRVETAISSLCENPGDDSRVALACSAFNELSAADKIDALSTISPEEVVAEFTSTLNMTKDQTGNLANRLNALRGGATGFSLAGLNYINGDDVFYGQWLHEMADQISGNAGGEENFSRLGLFINGSITDGEKDTTSLERGYDLEGDSITLGADYRISNTLVAGVAYGKSDTEIDFTTNNKMTNEIDNMLFYGSWYKDQFYVDGVVGYASGDIETRRRIQVGSIDEVVGGETESSQIFFSITGNFDFVEGALTYGPYASLDYIDGEIDGYEEVGTTGFEVGFADQDIKSQVLTFGGRVQYAWSQPWGIIVPHARAEWKTELEDDRDAIVGRFVLDQSANEFSIEADDLDADWFQLALGVSATFQRGFSAYIDYEQAVSYDDTDIETFSFGGRWEAKF